MSEEGENRLRALKNAATPAPSEGARRRALDAAMLAFDAARQEEAKNTSRPTQGKSWWARLRSIVPQRSWIMDTRITLGLGTAAVALLLLPLGYQLYTSTAITPIGVPPVVHPTTVEPQQPVATTELKKEDLSAEFDRKERTVTVTSNGTVSQDKPTSVVEPAKPVSPDVVTSLDAVSPSAGLENLNAPIGGDADQEFRDQTVMAQKSVESSSNLGRTVTAAPMTAGEAPMDMAAGMVAPEGYAMPMPEPTISPTEPSGDEFTQFEESPVKIVAEAPVSTFSIDVDTASYSYIRQALTDGWMPEPDAVRLEEMINYFDYDYAGPDSAETPFKANMQIYPTPWNPKTQLLQIGIKGYVPPVTEDKASNLTFLIDTSGSMDEPDKLPLLKRAFALLVNQLSANDTVSIVVYAGSAGVVLEPTKATEKAKILSALENLAAGGSTAGAEGIELAYRLAEQNKVDGGINRVILATDGDFNVGIDDPEDLETFIKGKRDQGVSLSVLGFGQGNLGDDTMQALAQNGNGNASYIDSFKEAQKVLVQEIGGTLETIAKDVKIQVEFNPALVSEYRLVGYETRALNREDFNNDKVDAGDIGAGHTVTAIYEITPVGSGANLNDPLRYGMDSGTPTAAVLPSDEIGFLKMRYKAPDGDVSKLIETPITKSLSVDSLERASNDARWAAAVAAFGQKLKGSNYGDMSYDAIKQLAQGARGSDEQGYRAEFMQLINSAEIIDTRD
jgi:Ca-activated chloride channel family protein